jgi:hypothetical protein
MKINLREDQQPDIKHTEKTSLLPHTYTQTPHSVSCTYISKLPALYNSALGKAATLLAELHIP